jgi:Protein-L-isoaspartate carboxylmethyltransferase
MRNFATFVEEQAQLYRGQLVYELVRKGALLRHSPLYEAFLVVPRHAFIDHYYEQAVHGFAANRVPAPDEDADQEQWHRWLQQIYTDAPLVTQVDEKGLPTSSSSMPSMMIAMLHALELEPGQRVVEIGTGTGYNAAIMTLLVGANQLVTSLEIDATLAQLAQQRLEHICGKGVLVYSENALTWQGDALVDRVLATTSWPTIPLNWIAALALQGILVMELHGDFVSVLLQLQKVAPDRIDVVLIPAWHGCFMRMRSQAEAAVQHAQILSNLPTLQQTTISIQTFAPELFKQQPGLALMFQCRFPMVGMRRIYRQGVQHVYLIDEQRSAMVQFQANEEGWQVTASGNYNLWQAYLAVYQQWSSWGCPSLNELHMSFDMQRGMLLPGQR